MVLELLAEVVRLLVSIVSTTDRAIGVHKIVKERLHPALLLKALPRVFLEASSEWVDDNAQRLGASARPCSAPQSFSSTLSTCPSVWPTFSTVWTTASFQANVPALRSCTSGARPSGVTFTVQSVK